MAPRMFLSFFVIGALAALALSVLSPRLRAWPWSYRLGCSLGGAAVGTMGSAMLVLVYPSLLNGILGPALLMLVPALMGVGIQTSVREERFPFFPFL